MHHFKENKMNKLQMAQEYALKMLENLNPMQIDKPTRDGIAYECFELAEAMLAENDKRVVKLPDVFFDTNKNEEWQPDWSQAPEWADWWAMDGFSKKANWWCLSVMHGAMWLSREPICTKATWAMLNDVKFCAASFDEAPSFNYQGNWQDSLRKRPQ